YLGVGIGQLDPARREQLKLPKNVGLLAEHVEANGPAEKAGVQSGDVLEKLNDQLLIHPFQFTVLVRTSPAQEVKLTVLRGGQRLVIPVKLEQRDLPELGENVPMTVPQAGDTVLWRNGAAAIQQARIARQNALDEQLKLDIAARQLDLAGARLGALDGRRL